MSRCSVLLAVAGQHWHDIVELPGGVSPQLPLSHGEPGDDVDWSGGGQLDVLVARRRRRWLQLGVLHLVVGCVVVSRKVTSCSGK